MDVPTHIISLFRCTCFNLQLSVISVMKRRECLDMVEFNERYFTAVDTSVLNFISLESVIGFLYPTFSGSVLFFFF
jgi:hypothetical protein